MLISSMYESTEYSVPFHHILDTQSTIIQSKPGEISFHSKLGHHHGRKEYPPADSSICMQFEGRTKAQKLTNGDSEQISNGQWKMQYANHVGQSMGDGVSISYIIQLSKMRDLSEKSTLICAQIISNHIPMTKGWHQCMQSARSVLCSTATAVFHSPSLLPFLFSFHSNVISI